MEKIHNLPTEWDLTQFYADEAAFMEQMKRFELKFNNKQNLFSLKKI